MIAELQDKLRTSTATAVALLALSGAFVAPAGAQGQAAPAEGQNELDGDAERMLPLFTEFNPGDGGSGDAGTLLVLASTLIAQPVYNLNGVDEVGRISDLAVGADGTFVAFVLSVGEREVTVERGQIAWAEFEPGLRVLAMNAAAGVLDAAPDFDREAVIAESAARNGIAEGHAATTEAAGAQDEDPAQVEGGAPQAEGGGAQSEAGTMAKQAGNDAPGGASDVVDAQTEQVPAAEAADRHLLRGPDGTNDGIRPQGAPPQTLDGFATTGNNQPQQIQSGNDAEQAAGANASDPPQAPLTADNLDGLRVFGLEDEAIGSVTGVILTPEGEIEAVVVETGGFLGLGTHAIAVDFARVEFVQQAGMRAVQLDLTEEQMRDHPSYDADAYRNGAESPILR